VNYLKFGINVDQTTVAKYMTRKQRAPSPGRKTFLCNHAGGIIAGDMFVVPTALRLLVLLHARRESPNGSHVDLALRRFSTVVDKIVCGQRFVELRY